jgi:hypothetical protein
MISQCTSARRRRRTLAALLVAAATGVAPATASAATATTTATRTFNYTGSSQVFQVPPGVSSIHVVAIGGSGALGQSASGTQAAAGGLGASVSADLAVSSGDLFDVWVGGAGHTFVPVIDDTSPVGDGGPGGNASGAPGAGGAGGGGGGMTLGGAGGGGASELDDLGENVLLAAGGGGGGGGSAYTTAFDWLGGSGGNAGASPADGASLYGISILGGRGGGSTVANGTDGGTAQWGWGGGGGGGGGGGYPNGGDGGASAQTSSGGAGGGAGSSYVGPAASASSITSSTSPGNGRVTISWQQPAPVTVTLKSSKAQIAQGNSVTYTATVKPPTGDPLPTGTVTFVDQSTGANLATTQLSSTSPATATFSTSALPHGTTAVYASYRGDANYQSDASSGVSVMVYNRVLTLSPTAISFGTKPIGSSMSTTVTVKSTGVDPVAITSPTVSPTAYSITSSTCTGVTLNPGQTCAITVAFRPTAAGVVKGTLTVPDNGTPAKAALSGTGQ